MVMTAWPPRRRRAGGGRGRPGGQIGGCARFDDPPTVDDGDHVGGRHQPQSMGHDQHRPVASEPLDGVANEGLARRIEVGGRLVEDDQPRALRNARASAIRWRWPPLSRIPPRRQRVVTLRQVVDEVSAPASLGGLAQRLVRGLRLASRMLSATCRGRGTAAAGPRRRAPATPRGRSSEGTPSTRIEPAPGSMKRSRRLAIVVLPAPVAPTRATSPRCGMQVDRSARASSARIGEGHPVERDVGRGRHRDARTGRPAAARPPRRPAPARRGARRPSQRPSGRPPPRDSASASGRSGRKNSGTMIRTASAARTRTRPPSGAG